jgi:hypothetical protein
MHIWTIKEILELGFMSIMILMVIGIFVQRIVSGKSSLGARVTQLLAVGLLIPGILVLALETVLTSETVAALLGGLAGYLLSDVGRYDPKDQSKSNKTQGV